MAGWTKVRWTQARQVTRLMGVKDREAPAEAVLPEAWCGTLRETGRLGQAVSFVGHALPRFESVAWATAQVRAIRGAAPVPPAAAAVLAAVEAWLDTPDDALRRTAYAAGEALDEAGAEQLLGYAVYFSGGSIAPDDLPPVLPRPELCGRFAATAILVAAVDAADPDAALAAALAAGEAVAAGVPRAA